MASDPMPPATVVELILETRNVYEHPDCHIYCAPYCRSPRRWLALTRAADILLHTPTE